MDFKEGGIFYRIKALLDQDYRGVNIAVYALATAGLAASIHKIRPVSKFSKASKVPDHFIKKHEPLRGVFVGIQHSPVRLLINHKAPINLPLWHSSKPPLPVKLWGVEIVSGNAVNWLECVAKGKRVTLKPMARDEDDLVSTVHLHLPQAKAKTEILDVGQKLVELGFAKAAVPNKVEKKTVESQLVPVLLLAEARAKNYRNGIWSELLPPLPLYVVYWRKGVKLSKEMLVLFIKKTIEFLAYVTKSTFVGTKSFIQRAIKSRQAKEIHPSKEIQTS